MKQLDYKDIRKYSNLQQLVIKNIFEYLNTIENLKKYPNLYTNLNIQVVEKLLANRSKDQEFWHNISISQKLSEDFIIANKDKVNWDSISINQILSEDFIREFHDKVNKYFILKYQKLNRKFKEI